MILDVKMMHLHVDLPVLPESIKYLEFFKEIIFLLLTLRADRPFETVSLVLIRFVDKLDGDTSIIPDVLLCSLSWCTGVVDNVDSAVWFNRRDELLLLPPALTLPPPFDDRFSGVVERARLLDS